MIYLMRWFFKTLIKLIYGKKKKKKTYNEKVVNYWYRSSFLSLLLVYKWYYVKWYWNRQRKLKISWLPVIYRSIFAWFLRVCMINRSETRITRITRRDYRSYYSLRITAREERGNHLLGHKFSLQAPSANGMSRWGNRCVPGAKWAACCCVARSPRGSLILMLLQSPFRPTNPPRGRFPLLKIYEPTPE